MELDNQAHLVITREWFHLSYRLVAWLIIGFLASLFAVYWFASQTAQPHYDPIYTPVDDDWKQDSGAQLQHIRALEQQTQHHLEVLTQYVGRIEANLIQINALGERMVHTLRLDPKEFNFTDIQALPVDPNLLSQDPLLGTLKQYEALLEKRYTQLAVANQQLQTKLAKQDMQLQGSGKAAPSGYVSSYYGYRKDPLNGRKAWHAGVDIAANEGSEIKALASGIVSYAAQKGGYGRLVEINHGNGLVTRYGHNKSVLVQRGQLVHKGERIALVGSSGRSTGPHVHLEVHKDGETIDPGRYFSDLARS